MSISIPNSSTESYHAVEVEVAERISPKEFHQEYVRKNRPVLLRGMMDQWPAMQRWSLEFFHGLGDDSKVLLEEGNVMQDQTGFRQQGFRDFIEQLMQGDGDVSRKSYLSVFKIFDAFPQLRDDVDFSILDQFKLKSSTVGWIGPAGTVTGYHIDWGDNILAQIHGRKELHLAAPSETKNMYVSRKFDQGTTISQVDLTNYDAEQFPNFAHVTHQRFTLHPGEMVFIPRGWWHHVRSLDTSISVSNITYDLRGIFFDAIPHRVKQKLHDAGLWKCECTCHVRRDGKWCRK